jgi:dienelactone hydrolase
VARPRREHVVVGILTVLLGLTGCAADISTLHKRLEPHYRTQRPQGPGPFAAILLVPGCGGVAAARLTTADDLVRRGYVVAFVDYLSARGLQTACRGEVTPDDVAQDIRAASAYISALPSVRKGAIGAVGWSLGGGGVLASLAGSDEAAGAPFRTAAAFYPVCRGLRPWTATVPVLVLLAGRDDIAPPALCEEVVRALGPRHRVDVRRFADARHSFDMSDLPAVAPSRAFPGRTTGYHSDAARQAWTEVLLRFDAQLK